MAGPLRRLGRRLSRRLVDLADLVGPQRRSNLDLLFQWLAYLIVDRLSILWSRDDRLWVFGARGGEAFCDNAKYLFLWVAANDPSIRPVWLSTNDTVVETLQTHGYEAYHARSLWGRYYTLRAGVVFVTQGFRDVFMGGAAGATLVQLWHGLPLKTVAWDAEWPAQPWPVRQCHRYMAGEIDLVTAPSSAAIEPLSSGLGIDPDRFVVTGYPRTDTFVTEIEGTELTADESLVETIEERATDHPLVFYLPTYRAEGDSFVEAFDVSAVGETLAAHDAHLYVKAHPYEPVSAAERHPRVHWLPPSVDPYLVLPHADVLLTDYSSVAFDYLRLDRPMVFFPYDLEAYTARRALYFEYEAVTPGAIATDSAALRSALDGALAATAGGTDPFAADRRHLRDRLYATPPGDASRRVYEAVSALVFEGSIEAPTGTTAHPNRSTVSPGGTIETIFDRF
ncbi:MAG: CDP-glycerol glycerophosphotransferase family protein [Halohasta sp.]